METKMVEPPKDNSTKIALYQNPDYVTLYRYENPNVPYDDSREGIVSKKSLIGGWYCDNFNDLKTYTMQRIEGQKGGRFVTVRVEKKDLEKYDATKLPETADMDIEAGNYIIPDSIGNASRVEVESVFKDSWIGKKNVPMSDWQAVEDYINQNLTDESIILRLQK